MKRSRFHREYSRRRLDRRVDLPVDCRTDGGLLVVRGQMTTGDLVAFVMLLLTITASLSVLAQTGASVVEAVGASVEIFAVIDREPAIPNDWSSKSDSDRATELRLARGDAAGCAFEDVVFSYASRPDLRVLDGLTLRIPAKSRAALVCVEIKFRTPHAIDATFSP